MSGRRRPPSLSAAEARHRAIVRDEALWEHLTALTVIHRQRREHIEACMSCTSGMRIAAYHGSVDDCMRCPTLQRITQDVESEHAYRAREAKRALHR